MLKISANFPWSGGIIAPPNIIMIKNAEPWDVYFPKPEILNVKIQGHMIEQNKPPESNAYKANWPDAKIPMSTPITPNVLNIFNVVIGLSFARKNPPICMATQTPNNKISVEEYFPKLTKRITPKAT